MKLTIAFGLLLAVLRIYIGYSIPPESFHWVQAYKDTAHIFIGGLAVSWWYEDFVLGDLNNMKGFMGWRFKLFMFLCIVEVIVAVLSRL